MTRAVGGTRPWSGLVVVPAPRTPSHDRYALQPVALAPPAAVPAAPPVPTPPSPSRPTRPPRDWDALADAAIEGLDWNALTEAALERLLLDRTTVRREVDLTSTDPVVDLGSPEPSVAAEQDRRYRLVHALTTLLGAALTTGAVVLFLGLAIVPRTGAYSTLTVLSGSMSPHIPAGAVVVDVPVRADRLVVGDVITFRAPRDGQPVLTHRVHSLQSRGPALLIRTKGDANAEPDPWTIGIDEPASTDLDRVAFVVPHLGEAIAALRTPAARLVLGWGAPALLCMVLLRRIWRRT